MSDKVIIASFGKTRTARTATQYQYNHGQKLQFENVDLPANYEVHFSNSVNGEAKTRMGDSTGVVIPPEYFVPGSTIYAWIYVTDEDSGITIRKVEIPISVKAKPTDQPLEPEDESLVEQVVNRLNETIDEIPNKIDQALEDAKESGEFNGPKGDPFTYDDFTPEQLEGLKGPKGDSFTYDDFTPEQLEGLKGPKGDSFTYDDFTPEELEELTGPQGPEGSTIWTTNTPYSYSQETGRYYFAASNLRGPTNATKKLYDLVYLSDDTNKEYKAFYIVEFQYGGLQVGCRYLADMQGPPGEGATGAVLYSKAQALSESEKNRARQNIGAASISDLGVVFRLKGDVASVSDLPSTGNTPGDVYYVRAKQVGYVWLETQFNPDGYWEELGEPIDISNLPNTITWFTGTVDANDNFIPGEYLTIQNLVIAISNNRLPIVAISFSDGTIIKLPLLHYSFTNSASDYFVFYTVTSNPSKARLQPIKPLSEFYRISYYKELAAGGTLVWHRKYDHGYFVEHETIGDLSDLNTTDKSSIVNAINELVASGSSDVAVFDFIISLENDEYVITRHPEYDDVYAAFEDGKIVIAKIRRINDSIWTDYCFIGTLEEAHDSTGGSVIYFSGETGPGNYFIIRGGKSGSVINGWEVVIDNSIWSAVDELESEISEKYTKPGSGIPASDLASAVQTSLGKADTALQTAPVTSVNGQTGAVSISVPSGSNAIPQALGSAWGGSSSDFSRADHVHPKQTALDVGAVAIDQGSENAGKVLVVSSLGVVVPGSYYYNNNVVVNLVITGLDYSGTMDMTPAELSTEYFAGKHIIAYVPAINMRAELFSVEAVSGGEYEFNFTAVGEFNSQDVIARFTTSSITNTFTTKIYPLATGQWTGGSY